MAGNSFGTLFRLTTFGESHGKAIGGIIDGCPAGIELDFEFIQQELNRRRPGQSKITTQRKEEDKVIFLSGVFEGRTTGTPIAFEIINNDAKRKDYSHLINVYRPSHADYTYQQKYGIRDYKGGGRSSARETIARVVAGAIAKQILKSLNITISAYVQSVGNITLNKHYKELDFNEIESNPVRCPDKATATKMEEYIHLVRKQGDSIGGVVFCVARGVPTGLGEPVFDKLSAELAKAIMSINAVKGFEYGSGFEGTTMKGSEHNDIFTNENNTVRTKTNYSGGIQGGISSGEDIYFRTAFKPVATLMRDQQSVDIQGNVVTLKGKGRHDPCVVPRAVVIVEAMTAIVLLDMYLRNQSKQIWQKR